MWKTFTSAALIVLLVQGCGTSGVRGREAAPTGEADDVPTDVEEAEEAAPPGKPAPPEPEVDVRNAKLFARATELFLEDRLVEAEALLLEVTSDQPELAGPWVNLAQVYLAQGRQDEAVAALERAVVANPANCAARTTLGVLLRRQGEFAGAESHYLACLEYQPDYQAAHLNLGILYDLYLGRWSEALAAYRRYQDLAAEPDQRVNLWVVDLERRLDS